MGKQEATGKQLLYPKGQEKDFVIPERFGDYRFALGKVINSKNPLVAICMNPSSANEDMSDRTINRIISISQKMGHDGWIVFNLYPDRATDAKNLEVFKEDISKQNIDVIRSFLLEHNIHEVWGAWGNCNKHNALEEGRKAVLALFKELNVKVFYFGSLTNQENNPRHPLQRFEPWKELIENNKKKYLEF